MTAEQPIRAPGASEGAVSSDLATGAVFSNLLSSRFQFSSSELSAESTIVCNTYIYIYMY